MKTPTVRRVSWLALLLLSAVVPARAQEAPKPPSALSGLAKALGRKAAGTLDPKLFRFKPAGKPLFYDTLAEALGQDAEQKKALRQLLAQGAQAVESELAKAGHPHDLSAGLAVCIAVCWEIVTGKEPPEAGSDALLAQLRAALDSPELRAAGDADKQKIYEYGVGFAVFLKAMQEIVEDADAKKGLTLLAGQILEQLVGAGPDALILDEKGIRRKGAVSGTAPAKVGDLRLEAPAGWSRQKEDGGTIYTRKLATRDYPDEPLMVSVLVVDQIQSGDPNTLVRGFYDRYLRPRIPEGVSAKPGVLLKDVNPEIYRRLAGNGMRCWFTGVSWANRKGSLDYFGTKQELHLYAVESAGGWQPVFVFVTGHDGDDAVTGRYVNPSVRDGWLEEALRALRGTPSGKPLFTVAEMAGDYQLSEQTLGPYYVNALTGASVGNAMVLRNHKISLKSGGAYTSVFVGGSGIGTVNIQQEKEVGTARVVNDAIGAFLVRRLTTGTERRDRLVGHMTLPDGRKMLLNLPQGYPPTTAAIWQYADRYFMEKK